MSVWAVLRGRAFNESLGFWQPDQVGIRACDTEAHRPVGPAVADLADAIEALPGVQVTGPVATTVGGRPATHLEVAVDASACAEQSGDCGGGPCTTVGYLWGREGDSYPTQAGLQHGIGTDARILLWIVDVDGARIVIEGDLVPSEGRGFEEAVRRLRGLDHVRVASIGPLDRSGAHHPCSLGCGRDIAAGHLSSREPVRKAVHDRP